MHARIKKKMSILSCRCRYSFVDSFYYTRTSSNVNVTHNLQFYTSIGTIKFNCESYEITAYSESFYFSIHLDSEQNEFTRQYGSIPTNRHIIENSTIYIPCYLENMGMSFKKGVSLTKKSKIKDGFSRLQQKTRRPFGTETVIKF